MGRGTYASGKWALGECARSGRKMLLRNMIADGYYPNLIVDPHWYEGKHPQESLPSVHDPVTLFRPAPDRDLVSAQINLGGVPDSDPVPGGGFGDSGGGGATGGGADGSAVSFGYEIGGVGFEIVAPEIFGDPDDWTLIEGWDTNNGLDDNEMAAIDSAFGGNPRGSSVIWSPDGTIITLCSDVQARIRSFTCSIPFDPDTATELAVRSVSNIEFMFANRSGSIIWGMVLVNDEISAMPASNFVIGTGSELSDINKSEVGWTGGGDGIYYCKNNLDDFLWDGRNPTIGRVRRVTPSLAGNLDSFSTGPIETAPYSVSTGIGPSKISNDGKCFYRGVGAPGVEFVEMDNAMDMSSTTVTVRDISTTVGFFVKGIWINPDNTSEVWCVGSNSGGLQLARMATNL